VVAPVFNEEVVLDAFHRELTRTLDETEFATQCEVIYVDDGSTDSTPAILTRLACIDPRVRFVCLSRNFGNQAAVTAGLERSRGDAVVTMDSDLQHPPAVIRDMLAEWRAGCDVVVTVRRDDPSLSLFKRVTVPIFYRALRSCGGIDLKPTVCDFRLLSRKAVDALLAMPERNRFLRGMVHWLGLPSRELSFDVPPRFAGRSKFTFRRLSRLARDTLFSFSNLTLKGALFLAAAMLFVSFVGMCAAWIAFRPSGHIGWLILAAIAGVHLIGAGFWTVLLALSEYQARIHEQLLGRPLYVVRESSDDERQIALVTTSYDSAERAA
jgi:dolichol-phosphate mannosyltransferase